MHKTAILVILPNHDKEEVCTNLQCQKDLMCKVRLQSLLLQRSCRIPVQTKAHQLHTTAKRNNYEQKAVSTWQYKPNSSRTSMFSFCAIWVTYCWHVFRWKFVRGVRNKKTSFSNSSIAHNHTLYSLHRAIFYESTTYVKKCLAG